MNAHFGKSWNENSTIWQIKYSSLFQVLSVTSECSQWETNQLGTKGDFLIRSNIAICISLFTLPSVLLTDHCWQIIVKFLLLTNLNLSGWLFRGSCSYWRSNWAELTSTVVVAGNRIWLKICPKLCCRKNQICLPNQIYKICLSNQIYGQEIEWNPSIWSNQAFQYGFETQTDALYYCIWWLRKPSGANM